jgi:hypothetical protein
MMQLAAAAAFRLVLLLAFLPGTQKQFTRLVRGARDWWSGKKIAVIGPTASGKDSLLARLQSREIPKRHSRSRMGESIKSFDVKLALSRRQVVDITCKGVINIGGEPEYRDAPEGWLSVCKGADVIFYVMTIEDLAKKRFLKKGRIRQDFEWLQTALPHLKPDVLIHVLINKIDAEIESHTDYAVLAQRLAKEIRAFDKTAAKALHPYETKYTGATLISMRNKQIYTVAILHALRAVHSAFHETSRGRKAA